MRKASVPYSPKLEICSLLEANTSSNFDLCVGIYNYWDTNNFLNPEAQQWNHEFNNETAIFYRPSTNVYYILFHHQPIMQGMYKDGAIVLRNMKGDQAGYKLKIFHDVDMKKFPKFVKVSEGPAFSGIYCREHASRHGKVSYFHTTSMTAIHWSNRRKMWEISTPSIPGKIIIYAVCEAQAETPISDNWIEHRFSVPSPKTFTVKEFVPPIDTVKLGDVYISPKQLLPPKAKKFDDKCISLAYRSRIMKIPDTYEGNEQEIRFCVGLKREDFVACLCGTNGIIEDLANLIGDFISDQACVVVSIHGKFIRTICGVSERSFLENYECPVSEIIMIIADIIHLKPHLKQIIATNEWVRI